MEVYAERQIRGVGFDPVVFLPPSVAHQEARVSELRGLWGEGSACRDVSAGAEEARLPCGRE